MTHAPTKLTTLLLVLSLLLAATPARPDGTAPRSATKASADVRHLITDERRRALYLVAFEQHVMLTYAQLSPAATGLPMNVFREAMLGYYGLQQRGLVSPDQQVLTLVDFSRPSREKRLWVVDLRQQRVLFHSLVAHGRNTGDDLAQTFSNRDGSEMSSLGFYRTGRTYTGKHGLSLKLNGLDPGYNTNVASRSVVVHGADYVSEDFIRQHGRLGRSQGCPALPSNLSSDIIRAIKGGTVLYVHGPVTAGYASDWLQLDPALVGFAHSKGIPVAGY